MRIIGGIQERTPTATEEEKFYVTAVKSRLSPRLLPQFGRFPRKGKRTPIRELFYLRFYYTMNVGPETSYTAYHQT